MRITKRLLFLLLLPCLIITGTAVNVGPESISVQISPYQQNIIAIAV